MHSLLRASGDTRGVGKVLLDFDGTLAFRRPWSQCLIDVLSEISPNHQVGVEDIRNHLKMASPGTDRNDHTLTYPMPTCGGRTCPRSSWALLRPLI